MRVSRVIALSAVLLLAISCGAEKKKVENLVVVYNDVLVDALLRPNPKLMQNFTTKRENVRVSSYIALLAKDNKILEGDIVELDFRDVRLNGNEAEVVTRERWVYKYLDIRTRRPVSREYDSVYSNTYLLKKEEGRWVVDNIDTKELVEESVFSEQGEIDKVHRDIEKKERE